MICDLVESMIAVMMLIRSGVPWAYSAKNRNFFRSSREDFFEPPTFINLQMWNPMALIQKMALCILEISF